MTAKRQTRKKYITVGAVAVAAAIIYILSISGATSRAYGIASRSHMH